MSDPPHQPPGLEFAFAAQVDVGDVADLGAGPRGHRRIVPILGGTFEGPSLRGRVLAGADWQIVRPDGALEIEATYSLETDDGAGIAVVNGGLRHATPEVMARLNRGEPVARDEVYFRTAPRFETSAPEYEWLTRSLFVGYGERRPSQVVIEFWRVR